MGPRRGAITSCVLRAGQIVPDRLTVPMKYVQNLTFSGAAGIASYVFSQNSVYDPNVTGTGGSCTGFNTLSALYYRYRVLSSRIRVTTNSGSTVEVAVAVAPAVINFGSSVSAVLVAASRLAKPDAIKMLPVNGNGPAVVLTDSISTSEILGDQLYDEVSLYGLGNADPATQFYWTIGTNDINGLSYAFGGIVELEYVTEWSMPKDTPS